MAEKDLLTKMFEMHVRECDSRDTRTVKAIDEIKSMFKGIWDAHDEMRKTVTGLQIKASLVLGGLIVIGKIYDYIVK